MAYMRERRRLSVLLGLITVYRKGVGGATERVVWCNYCPHKLTTSSGS